MQFVAKFRLTQSAINSYSETFILLVPV